MASSRPTISVVIPSYNYGALTLEALDSALNQTLRNVEVIIVDGGSTSAKTIEVLRSIHCDRATVHLRAGRHLVGSNRNFGIERAHGEYICCLDADDVLDPTYLEKAYYLAEAGGIDVVSTSVRAFGARRRPWDIGEQPTLERL